MQSSFLGLKLIVYDDFQELPAEFQKVKLASINDKLDYMPTKEENERVKEKLSSFHTSMMDILDRVESLLRPVHLKLDGNSENNDYL